MNATLQRQIDEKKRAKSKKVQDRQKQKQTQKQPITITAAASAEAEQKEDEQSIPVKATPQPANRVTTKAAMRKQPSQASSQSIVKRVSSSHKEDKQINSNPLVAQAAENNESSIANDDIILP